MSNFEPLSWELQFNLQNQGRDLLTAEVLLGKLNKQLLQGSQFMLNFQKISQVAFSGIGTSTKNAVNQLTILQTQIGKTNAALSQMSRLTNQASSFGRTTNGSSTLRGSSQGGVTPGLLSSVGSSALIALGGVTALGYGLKKVYDGIDSVTERAVASFSERQSSLRAYTLLLRSSTEAEKQYFTEAAIAQKTELSQTQIRGISNRLITAGFRGDDLDRARLNATDLVTLRPQHLRETSANQLAELYSKVRGQGYIQEGLLNRTASRFVNGQLIREEIGKSLGLDAKGVQGALKNRQVSSETFFAAFQNASNRQLGTRKTGEFALGAGGNLAALISNQEEALENLFRSINPETLVGVKLYKESIMGLTNAMDYSTKTGKDLRFTLEQVSDAGTGLRAAGNELLTGFLESFGSSFRTTAEQLSGSATDSKNGMISLGVEFKKIGTYVGNELGPALYKIIDAFHDFGGVLYEIGTVFDSIGAILTKLYSKLPQFVNGLSEKLGIVVASRPTQGGQVQRLPSQYGKGLGILDEDSNKITVPIPAIPSGEVSEDFTRSTGGGGRGGGKRGGGGERDKGVLFQFDYTRPLPVIPLGMGASAQLYGVPLSLTPPAIQSVSANQLGSTISVQNLKVEVIVPSTNASPEQIADQLYLKLGQTFGRLVRAPSAGGI